MTSGTWSHEVESPVSAGRLFKAAILDWHNLGPKIVPAVVVSAFPISGDGGVGSIRQLNFSSAVPYSYVKERLEFVDHQKFESKQSQVEGGDVGKKLESASTHFKFEPLSNGGCVVKVVTTYKTRPGIEAITEEITKAKDGVTGMLKTAEAYLLANPTAYA